MELGKQIKKFRKELNFSQEELAEKIYVTRQSISNWENDKNYPDLNSLLLMSEVFNISLDELVKGDIGYMKEKLDNKEIDKYAKYSSWYSLFLGLLIFIPYPLIRYLKWYGIAIYIAVLIASMYFANKVEKMKKDNDLQTFKDINDFLNGKKLDQIDRAKAKKVGVIQTIFLTIAVAVLTFGVFLLFDRLLG